MRTVRTTINPTVEIEVDDAEYADLKGNGLLLDTRATTDAGLIRAAVQANADRGDNPARIPGNDDTTPDAPAPDEDEQDDDADSGEKTEG